eukprot:scaffold1839_cov382-Prasinococcus_capsulatus_cf.AAC.3
MGSPGGWTFEVVGSVCDGQCRLGSYWHFANGSRPLTEPGVLDLESNSRCELVMHSYSCLSFPRLLRTDGSWTRGERLNLQLH